MARQFQTETVTAGVLNPGDMVLRGNGKYRRVLHAWQPEGEGRGYRVNYLPNGHDWFTSTQDITIKHRDPKCACGCDESTRGGIWAPGHDGRVAGLGGRAITGDTDALRALAHLDPNTLPTGRPSGIEHNPEAECDASCQFAHRELCVCSCGGTGHFMGWVAIGHMLLEDVPEVLTIERRREWATRTYIEGRRYHQASTVTTGPVSRTTVAGINYDVEDLDTFIRRMIPVEPEVQGDCPKSGEFTDTDAKRIDCSCGRNVAVRPNGRIYGHQVPVVEEVA